MNTETGNRKSWKDVAPYLAVAIIVLLVGRVVVGTFSGDSGKPGVAWEVYSEAAYQSAVQQQKPVMLYFSADWCGPCRLLREKTFTDADVMAEAARFARFKVDLTNPQGEMAKAGEKFSVMALPTVVFIGKDGKERIRIRMTGFEDAARFRQRMKAVPE